MNDENAVKYAVSLLLGFVAGAVVALLFAPSSGKDLRTNIKTQADTEYASLHGEVQKGMQDMQARMDKLSSELQAMSASRSK